MLILGINVKSGEFEGKKYENVYITFEKEINANEPHYGTCAEVVKFKSKTLIPQLKKLNVSLSELIGQDFGYGCDRFGNPAFLI